MINFPRFRSLDNYALAALFGDRHVFVSIPILFFGSPVREGDDMDLYTDP